MIRAVSLLIAILLPSVTYAQLDLQSEYLPYEKIVAEYRWTPVGDQEIDLIWDVPNGIEYEQVGNRLFLWATPSSARYDLRLTTQTKTYEEVELAGGTVRRFMIQATIQLHRKQFYVRGNPDTPDPPLPPPDPDDPDIPDPVPEGYLGFTAKAFDLAMNIPATYRNMKIDIIADNFARVAKSTAHPRDMVAELTQRNRDAIPPDSPAYQAWFSAFFTPWETYAGGLTQSGEFVHITQEFQRVFQATADGLKRAQGGGQ